ncbi:hypothetical protein IE53DRAFT_381321 [Violaceomyces palustris]|uniref:Uncharacterized protein n=1 Tax=Violaceomyces palustris TaxID=1673888 RepID=A0ACD0NRU2_9BASI|nr:hypothetical protein IE53DRAFT_381321 [Violaceomyces palustris]
MKTNHGTRLLKRWILLPAMEGRTDCLTLALTPCLSKTYRTPDHSRRMGTLVSNQFGSSDGEKEREKGVGGGRMRRKRKKTIQLDPRRPLFESAFQEEGSGRFPKVYPSLSSSSSRSREEEDWIKRSKLISELYTSLERGSADLVFESFRNLKRGGEGWQAWLSPEEMGKLIRCLISDRPKTRLGMIRLSEAFRVAERLKGDRRGGNNPPTPPFRPDSLDEVEKDRWDRVLDTATRNALIDFSANWSRSSGPAEIDEAIKSLAEYEGKVGPERIKGKADQDEANALEENGGRGRRGIFADETDWGLQLEKRRRKWRTGKGQVTKQPHPRSHGGKKLDRRSLQERGGRKLANAQGPNFPDLRTYNILLETISRSVPFHDSLLTHSERREGSCSSSATMATEGEMDPFLEEDGRERTWLDKTTLATLGLPKDWEGEEGFTGETCERLFDRIWERMVETSGIEPDQRSWSIRVKLLTRLGRWNELWSCLNSALEKGKLNTAVFNSALWGVGRSVEGSLKIRELVEIYGMMRGNLVELEREKLRLGRDLGRWEGKSRNGSDVNGDGMEGGGGGDSEVVDGCDGSFERQGGKGADDRRGPTRSSPNQRGQQALARIFGMSHLPREIVPDKITYSIMIKLTSWSGDFATSIGILKDMTSTPAGREGGEEEEVELLTPDISIYDSLFRAFSKHSIASKCVKLDRQRPWETQWEVPCVGGESGGEGTSRRSSSKKPLSNWNVLTLSEIFESLLEIRPSAVKGREEVATRSRRSTPSSDSREVKLIQEDQDATGRLPPRMRERMERTMRDVLSSPPSPRTLDPERASPTPPPTPKQLFWILTSLRRSSGDHPEWVLSQWDRLVNKFGGGTDFLWENVVREREGGGEEEEMVSDSVVNDQGWKGFRIDQRIKRILRYLGERRGG